MPYLYNRETGKHDIYITREEAEQEYGYGNLTNEEKADIYDWTYGAQQAQSKVGTGKPLSEKLKGIVRSMSADLSKGRNQMTYGDPRVKVIEEDVEKRGAVLDAGRNPRYGEMQSLPMSGPLAPEPVDVEQLKQGILTPHPEAGAEVIPAGMFAGNIGIDGGIIEQYEEAEYEEMPFIQGIPGAGVRANIEQNIASMEDAELYRNVSGGLNRDMTTSQLRNSTWYQGDQGVHALTFQDNVAQKVAYIEALNMGVAQGMIPAGARIGDASISAYVADKTGMNINTVKRLGTAIAGTAASALVMGATGNFPLAAMAYFGVNTLLGSGGRQEFKGVRLGSAAVDGVHIPELKMVLPSGLPNQIFSDYQYICYDRVSLKWYPSDQVYPLNYDGGNDYRWLALDRVTGKIYKCNFVKRPRIFLD